MEYLRVTGAWMKLYEVFRHLGSYPAAASSSPVEAP